MNTNKNTSLGTPFAPPITIYGTVVDEFGDPIDSANIYLKNDTTVGTTSNSQGYFTLANVPFFETVVISYVGFQVEKEPMLLMGQEVELQTLYVLDTVVIDSAPQPTPQPAPPSTLKTGYYIMGAIALGYLASQIFKKKPSKQSQTKPSLGKPQTKTVSI